MHTLRRRTWASGVLLVQFLVLVAMGAAPAFCCTPAGGAAAAMDCCKGDGHSCPLMKKQQQADPDEPSFDACTRTDERIATLLFGAHGVLVTAEPLPAPSMAWLVEDVIASEATRMAPADAPPPRA